MAFLVEINREIFTLWIKKTDIFQKLLNNLTSIAQIILKNYSYINVTKNYENGQKYSSEKFR